MIYWTFIIIFLAFFAFLLYTNIDRLISGQTVTESCGHVFNAYITNRNYPFNSCSDPSYELVCENNRNALYLNYGRHLVEAIYAANSATTLQSITAGVDNNNCSAISRHSLTYHNFSQAFTAKETELDSKNYSFTYYVRGLVFVSCQHPLSPDLHTDIVEPCASEAPRTRHSYVLPWHARVSDVEESCKIDLMVKVVPWGPMTCNENCSYPKVHSQEVKGIHITWRPNRCGEWEGAKGDCWFENATNMVLCRDQYAEFSLPLFRGFAIVVTSIGYNILSTARRLFNMTGYTSSNYEGLGLILIVGLIWCLT